MNIEGVNLLSLSPANSIINGGSPSLPENGAIAEPFSNTLIGQIGLLNKANGPVELPGQLKSMTMPQSINNEQNIGDLLKSKGGEEEPAALINNHLPPSYKKNEPAVLNKDVDLGADLQALSDALKSTAPSITPDAVAIAQNMSAAMASNGLPFVNTLPEETKFNKLDKQAIVSGDFLQKETAVLHQSIQNELGFNLQSLENPDPAEKTLMIEKKSAISGIEQAASGVTADMGSLHKQVDNRTDSPAIARPLTHPDWSKDLGNQIVWMNNKAISAAEIKLNPAHLGPISVRIDVNQDQATILFTAQHAEVKEAIEASIPKLREMLGTQQLNLINVNVSQNSTSDQGQSQSSYQSFSKTSENREQGIEVVTNPTEKIEPDQIIVNKGLLSIYA
jgi:flagellar hook-length control protein FliK